jgi:hypothetical protein
MKTIIPGSLYFSYICIFFPAREYVFPDPGLPIKNTTEEKPSRIKFEGILSIFSKSF